MKLLVHGIAEDHRELRDIEVEAPNSKHIKRNPSDYGFQSILGIREIRENTRRREGRTKKREY